MEDYLSKLGERIISNEFISRLDEIRAAVRTIWNPSELIIKNFPNHGVEHNNHIAKSVIDLLEFNEGAPISELETYVLLASIYLHDIGMQCDICKFPLVKTKAESLGANFNNIKFVARDSSDYNYFEQDIIRKNHQYLTAAWIDYAYNNTNNDSLLDKAVQNISDENILIDIKDVCLYHSKLDIKNCAENFVSGSGRKQLVAALLRFADELDISKDRVSPGMYEIFRIPLESSKYWWLHEHTEIEPDSNKKCFNLLYRINPADGDLIPLIKSYYDRNFINKNEELVEIIKGYEFKLLNINFAIVNDKNQNPIPEEIKRILDEKHYRIKDNTEVWSKSTSKNGTHDVDLFEYGIYFEIPHGWTKGENFLENKGDIQIVLSNKSSTIQIDFVKIPGGIIQVLGDWLRDSWPKRYFADQWEINRAIGYYYINYIVNLDRSSYQRSGTGLSMKPDSVLYPYYGYKENPKSDYDWIVAWTKPNYNDRIVGIHAVFKDNYDETIISAGGGANVKMYMQQPLYSLLSKLNINVVR
ncbi:MAG TPA: hypothetical protein PLX30_10140 [Methanothrix sp.]|nr:hypothetical protein [Methanothrix sp.]